MEIPFGILHKKIIKIIENLTNLTKIIESVNKV